MAPLSQPCQRSYGIEVDEVMDALPARWIGPKSTSTDIQLKRLSRAQRQSDFRSSYPLQEAMQACDLDQHSVKGPGVAAAHHVPPEQRYGFWLRLKLDCLA